MAKLSQIKSFFANYDRNFDQLCQAAMWQACNRFGSAPVVYPSAIAAYRASSIVGDNPLDALPGDFHYWSGGYGHVALELGAGKVLMGSSKIDESWGQNVGITTVARYNSRVGLKYLGFARSNGRNDISIDDPYTSAPAAPPSGDVQLRRVSGDRIVYYEPVGDLANRISRALIARDRLPDNYDLDGDPGPLWRKGVQRTLINAGLWKGNPDGRLGPNNVLGVQQYAKKFGDYDGPLDKDPRKFSWIGFALGLERP